VCSSDLVACVKAPRRVLQALQEWTAETGSNPSEAEGAVFRMKWTDDGAAAVDQRGDFPVVEADHPAYSSRHELTDAQFEELKEHYPAMLDFLERLADEEGPGVEELERAAAWHALREGDE
jgi:hypothetical protein